MYILRIKGAAHNISLRFESITDLLNFVKTVLETTIQDITVSIEYVITPGEKPRVHIDQLNGQIEDTDFND